MGRPSRYQQYLSLPPEVVLPDYYQLLGVERSGFMDPGSIEMAMQDRLAALGNLAEKDVAAFLKKELEEARATLLHPNRRDAYDQLLERERLLDLKKLVPAMLENKVLSAAAERAITHHTAAVGLDLRRIAMAIGEALREAGASRAPRQEPTDDAVAKAAATLRIALRPIADQRLEAAMAAGGVKVEAAPPDPEPEPAPPPEPEPPKPATRRVVKTPTETKTRPETRVTAVKKPATVVSAKPPTQVNVKPPTAKNVLPPPAPVPEPEPEPEPVADPEPESPEARAAMKMTELNERVASLERTKAIQNQKLAGVEPEMERIRRKLRRVSRCLLSALMTSLGFIAGHLARLAPGVGAKIDELTAPMRENIAQFESGPKWGGAGATAAAVLYILVVFLSGSEKKAGFLIPTIILTLGAILTGIAFMR